MIDIRKLKELVRLMVENDLSELDLRDQQESVSLRRPIGGGEPVVMARPASSGGGSSGGAGSAEAAEGGGDGGADDASLTPVTSPMVGTFYSAPNPDSAPFVSVGSQVSDETVVCLVEAMKVFSEIKAECSGTVEKVLVKNGEAVEFGQALFMVRTG